MSGNWNKEITTTWIALLQWKNICVTRNDLQYYSYRSKSGAKSVVLKTTGHEKNKLTSTLAANANGDKLKPYIAFPGHKREVQNLNKNPAIKICCYVESTFNDSINKNTAIDWVENVLKTFTFGKRRLFAWDSFRAHLVQSLKELLNKGKSTPLSFLVEQLDIFKRQTYHGTSL